MKLKLGKQISLEAGLWGRMWHPLSRQLGSDLRNMTSIILLHDLANALRGSMCNNLWDALLEEKRI